MSDYYGEATLEDWLAEEVYEVDIVPKVVVNLFEEFREGVEANIESWLASDDGDGNCLSWRGWGRGYYAIPDSKSDYFDSLIEKGRPLLNPTELEKLILKTEDKL